MNHDPQNPSGPIAIGLILSKGHAFPIITPPSRPPAIPESELATLRQVGSRLQGTRICAAAPASKPAPAAWQDFSIGTGEALGPRLAEEELPHLRDLSDGEIDEGQTWEAAAFAASTSSTTSPRS